MAIRGEVFIVSWVSEDVPSPNNIQGQAFESDKQGKSCILHTANLLARFSWMQRLGPSGSRSV